MKTCSLSRLSWYLLLIALLSVFCFLTLNVWLLPYSIAYKETGRMTPGYLLYAAIGLLFSTPAPFIAVLMIYTDAITVIHVRDHLKYHAVAGGYYAASFGTSEDQALGIVFTCRH